MASVRMVERRNGCVVAEAMVAGVPVAALEEEMVDEDVVHQDPMMMEVVQHLQSRKRSVNLLHIQWASNSQ